MPVCIWDHEEADGTYPLHCEPYMAVVWPRLGMHLVFVTRLTDPGVAGLVLLPNDPGAYWPIDHVVHMPAPPSGGVGAIIRIPVCLGCRAATPCPIPAGQGHPKMAVTEYTIYQIPRGVRITSDWDEAYVRGLVKQGVLIKAGPLDPVVVFIED